MRTIERMVEQEIICNVSHLVATLAEGYSAIERAYSAGLVDMFDQAFELISPIDDWEEAARGAGWSYEVSRMAGTPSFNHSDHGRYICDDWQDLCETFEIEPYQREVFEHWFVTEWFADRLEAKGEKVDKDFAAHCVWARTTTGQGIASDSVIQAIYADLVREYGE